MLSFLTSLQSDPFLGYNVATIHANYDAKCHHPPARYVNSDMNKSSWAYP